MTGQPNTTEDVLSQADALMRRPRTFVAQSRGPAPAPDDDDLPVLTEVVSADLNALPVAAQGTAAGDAGLSRAMEEELAVWLDTELPKAVMRVTDGLADRLIEELGASARTHLLAALRRRSAAGKP